MTSQEAFAEAQRRIAVEAEEKTGKLDLSGLWLERLPEEISRLSHLVELDVSGRYDQPRLPLESLTPIAALANLVSLNCSLTKVSDLGPISGLLSLTSLECFGAQISNLSPLSELVSLSSLDCCETQVIELSPLSMLDSLTNLNCSGTEVSDLGPLSALVALEHLSCGATPVCDLEPLSGLVLLSSLDCGGTQVADLTPLSGLASLASLNVPASNVSDLSPLSGLVLLEYLDCSVTDVSNLEPLAGLKSLTNLDCNETRVSDLSPLASLVLLEELNCSWTKVADLSPLSGLISLVSLSLSCCRQVEDLGPISGLRSLEELDFHWSQVSDLRPLSGLVSLSSLGFIGTRVSDLGPISELRSLTELKLSKTQVGDLGPLSGLASLDSLDCSGTQVGDLSPLRGLMSLGRLDCSKTQVCDLVPLSGLKSLAWLNCSETRVRDLGPLSCLISLSNLICSETPVSDLAPLSSLVSLESLSCSETEIGDLGPLLGIPRLGSLHCERSRCRVVPPELIWSESLDEIYLSGSPLEGIPPEILEGECLDELRAHCRDLEGGSEFLPDIKVIVLGNGRIGKTQLCNRLREIPFDVKADSTHGILVTRADLDDDPSKHLHLWDFGGQELYHGTHALFMKTRAIFVVVWSPESEDREVHEHGGMTFRNHKLPYWLEMVKQLGGQDSSVLVVQTRCDRPEDDRRRAPAEDSLLESLGFVKELRFSAANDRGLGILKTELGDAIGWMRGKQGEHRIGAGRMRVKRRLEQIQSGYEGVPFTERSEQMLEWNDFEAMCQEEGDVSSPDALLAYLHECGLLFYRRGLFHDRIILDQEWALAAIYAIFHRERCWKQLRASGGRFTREMLELLAWQEHSKPEQELFISMMEGCGICFEHRILPGGEKQYIAPDLLPELKEVAGDLAATWDSEQAEESEVLRFSYEYPGLMRSILSRVGKGAADNAIYWKTGFCGYESTTGSRVRIDLREVPEGDPHPLQIEIRGKGRGAATLLTKVLEWIAPIIEPTGCSVPQRKTARPGEKKLPKEDVETRKEPTMNFAQPPREGVTYAVSYAWSDESSALVDRLCQSAKGRDITIMRDKDSMKLGERISAFMKTLAAQDRVFIILSKKYLESPYCMNELLEVWRLASENSEAFLKKIRVFALPDAEFSTIVHRARRAKYWKDQYAEVEALMREDPGLLSQADFARFRLMQDFANKVGEILTLVADVLRPTTFEDLEAYGFDDPPKS